MQEAGSTEDVPACFSFGIVFFINAAIWRKTTMEFFNQAVALQKNKKQIENRTEK